MSRKRAKQLGRGGGVTNEAGKRRVSMRSAWDEPEPVYSFKNPVLKRCKNGDLQFRYPCSCRCLFTKQSHYSRLVSDPCRNHSGPIPRAILEACGRRSLAYLQAGLVL